MGQDLRVLCHTGDVQTVTTPHLFTVMISATIFTQSAWSEGKPYIRVFFLETRGLAGLRFLSCAANVQGTHRLPVTCSSFVFYC